MEHRWGRRLMTSIPVRLRCIRCPESSCTCLAYLQNVSASGALIRAQLGIRPAHNVVVETQGAGPCLQGRELPASIVRASAGEMAVEWMEFAPPALSALMVEAMLNSVGGEELAPTLARVRFCPLASTVDAESAAVP